ncbi:fungal zn binuclear cluster domain-containing protein [Fusarium mundagurra]|uniref:Fungal zn binuclear cluster domain-containing protein n=1 Tax=Fusarium mundagurra TaxID=1567541 RepID=A0A8H5Y8I9_9HYPO|nr:fungal zn binuclear cluster domain-containing protein [Fusarium mundagurra]
MLTPSYLRVANTYAASEVSISLSHHTVIGQCAILWASVSTPRYEISNRVIQTWLLLTFDNKTELPITPGSAAIYVQHFALDFAFVIALFVPIKAMKRLGYRKSRKGCLRCKQRRVKYGSPGGSDDRAWILDIELIHHYTAKAYRTLRTPCLHGTQVLQIEIPREGLTHPFLLHQILAFSALHLAYLNPDTRHKYLVQASQHQGVAISTMNSMLAKPWVPEACHALYGTSMFVAISAFGTFPSCDRYNAFQPIDSLIDIFILAHGMYVILRSFEENIRKGPLGKLMSGCSCEPASASSYITTIRPRLKDLLAHFEEKMPDISQDKRMCLVEITGTLIESIELAGGNQRATSVPEQRVIFGWPMRLPSGYITLLRNKDPLAMVILSYYCVLVHAGEIKCWYFRGWADALMKSIITIVAGTPWEGLIQWPVEAIKKTTNASDNRTP